jgi:hypothetical protein
MLAFVAVSFGPGDMRMSACPGLGMGALFGWLKGGTDRADVLLLSRVGLFSMLFHLIPFTRTFAKLSADAWLRAVRLPRELLVFLLC